ncbi:Microtubule-associated protein 70-5 [Striga hermonthica]|uniref:Microtubule-associated protein 70-5 n=1 Tax=Striga hermonthica TaxID=68872 RepID=A0A9N7R8T3_STRHE|nr:Microtubule-associated protein 70-5 [Striga hermonthica]
MKDKLKLRLKTLEEGLKHVPNCAINANGAPTNGKSSHFFGILSSNTRTKKRSTSQPRASTLSRSLMQMTADEKQDSSEILINGLRKKNTTGESLLRKSLWASRNKVIDSSEKENAAMNKNAVVESEMRKGEEVRQFADIKESNKGLEMADVECEDTVSGFLYDRLQKEVLNLRKACELKESTLNSKDEEIKLLMKKIETLTRAIEVESKKMKREAAIREKDSSLIKSDEKIRSTNSSKRLAPIIKQG